MTMQRQTMTRLSRSLTLACCVVALAACRKAPAPAEPPPRAVRVARVAVQPLASALDVSGVLTSREEAAVTSELSGYRVAKVLVDQDDWVKAGQPMLVLDDTLLRAQIDQLKAVLTQQQLAAEKAESQARNVEGLDNKGVLSQEDIDTRRFGAKSARAAAVAAAAQLADLQTRDERMTIRAPVSGRVLSRAVRPGDLAVGSAAGQPLFRIARDGLIELEADTPEADLGRIHPGQAANVTLPDGAQVAGKVRLIEPEVDAQTKLGHIRIAMPVRPDLRPGGFARALLPDLTASSLAAPDRAVIYGADGASVLVVDAANRARRVPVKTGARAGGMVELIQGPPAGSRVLVTGSSFVLDGDKVTPVEGSGDAGAAQ
ncbi:MAG TPA: efflux RND transporter periplasmic adaptor subunit [Caulobacteraceae bacterium]|nr:efflux RND transporter periplasmic adaptor subunit [Caulobacteraceae bacterium]